MHASAPILAHAKWVVDEPWSFPADWSFLLHPASLLPAGAALGAALVAPRLARRFTVAEPRFLVAAGRLSAWVPRLLGVALGAPLVWLALGGRFLAPPTSLDGHPGGSVLALAQAALGAWLVTGVGRRPAGLAVLALGLVGVRVTGLVGALEAAHLFGVTLYLVLLPRGPDRRGHRRVPADGVRLAVAALRVGVGVALVVGALSEKLANPSLAAEALRAYPELNAFRAVGLEVSDAAFARVAGAVEVALGLLVASGVAPRVVAFAVAVPFLATLPLFGAVEFLGHLPVYGALLALAAHGSEPAGPTRRVPAIGAGLRAAEAPAQPSPA